jgi:hypothetical protein
MGHKEKPWRQREKTEQLPTVVSEEGRGEAGSGAARASPSGFKALGTWIFLLVSLRWGD